MVDLPDACILINPVKLFFYQVRALELSHYHRMGKPYRDRKPKSGGEPGGIKIRKNESAANGNDAKSLGPSTSVASNASSSTANLNERKTRGGGKRNRAWGRYAQDKERSGKDVSARKNERRGGIDKKSRTDAESGKISLRRVGFLSNSAHKKTKVVIRRIPQSVSEIEFYDSVKKFEELFNYFQYVSPKADFPDWEGSRQLLGDSMANWARCYLNFITPEGAKTFYNSYDGHVFRDEKYGNEYAVVVEYAPFERLPRYFSCLPSYMRPVKKAVEDKEKDMEEITGDPSEGETLNGSGSSAQAIASVGNQTTSASPFVSERFIKECVISLRRKRDPREGSVGNDPRLY